LIREHPIYLALGTNGEERRRAFLSYFSETFDIDRVRAAINKGWALGSDDFVERMESVTNRSLRPGHRGRPVKKEGPGADSLHQSELQL
jgi:hypothetical protein